MANATGLHKLAMLESMLIPVLTHRDRRSPSAETDMSCNEISMWIYAKARLAKTVGLHKKIPRQSFSFLGCVLLCPSEKISFPFQTKSSTQSTRFNDKGTMS